MRKRLSKQEAQDLYDNLQPDEYKQRLADAGNDHDNQPDNRAEHIEQPDKLQPPTCEEEAIHNILTAVSHGRQAEYLTELNSGLPGYAKEATEEHGSEEDNNQTDTAIDYGETDQGAKKAPKSRKKTAGWKAAWGHRVSDQISKIKAQSSRGGRTPAEKLDIAVGSNW